jgi:hypothetical protein
MLGKYGILEKIHKMLDQCRKLKREEKTISGNT